MNMPFCVAISAALYSLQEYLKMTIFGISHAFLVFPEKQRVSHRETHWRNSTLNKVQLWMEVYVPPSPTSV